MCKYIVVIGGVYSGIGKGISASSIGMLLGMRGLKIFPLKLEPYWNLSASCLSPNEHGDIHLTHFGAELDIDLGSYERFIGYPVSSNNIITSGGIHKELIQEEEEGVYLGKTMQLVPHFTDKVIKRLIDCGNGVDVVLAELGGSCGDLESGPFLEAIRQFKQRRWNDVLIVMVAPILWIDNIKEFKTKPLQQAVKQLQAYGLQPDILLCRTDRAVSDKLLDKIAGLTNVSGEAIFSACDANSVYQVPLNFYDNHVDDLIVDKFHFTRNGVRIHKYRELVENMVRDDLPVINIGIVWKYENYNEAYLTIKEAISHAAAINNVRAQIKWIRAEDLEKYKDLRGMHKHFETVDGTIVNCLICPGGFGDRGIEGKINAIRYVREKKIPFLGICLGLQCATIEIARNVLNLTEANSSEFNPETSDPVVHFIPGQESIKKMHGSMRLGAYDCEIIKDTLAFDLYKKKNISERHRHRYEINNVYLEKFKEIGFIVSGKHPESGLVEIMELERSIHPHFIATQFHGEYKSRLTSPHPLFVGLIEAAIKNKKEKEELQFTRHQDNGTTVN